MKKIFMILFFGIFLIGLVSAAPCAQGLITGSCQCGSQTYDSGFCCNNGNDFDWFGDEYNQCPSSYYYVAPDGSDATGDGTYGNPWGTFLPAVDTVGPGDVIYARGGTYGLINTMPVRYSRNYSVTNEAECLALGEDWYYLDGGCFVKTYGFLGIRDYIRRYSYGVASGVSGSPITVRSYPGELAIFDNSDIPEENFIWYISEINGFQVANKPSIIVNQKEHWIIENLEFVGGSIMIGDNDQDVSDKNIIVRNNDIHDYTVYSGDNPGLIRIGHGASNYNSLANIFIWNNTLHGIYDINYPNDWTNGNAQLFGAVTVLSREGYQNDTTRGGTGYIEIMNNTIYDCIQVLFFKNPMPGPVEIKNNIISNSGFLGAIRSSNIHFTNNLVYNVSKGLQKVGGNHTTLAPDVVEDFGNNLTFFNNTFVGLKYFLNIQGGINHKIGNNIFYGILDSSNYYIEKDFSYWFDPADVSESLLQTITSDNNCFIPPSSGLDFVRRVSPYIPSEELYNYTEALATFGYDGNSEVIIENDPDNFFVDPANDDYHLIDPDLCPDMGYYALEAPEAPICEATSGICYYVASDGLGTNDGLTYDAPTNIENAVTSANPGDVIYFLEGTYDYENRMHDSGLIYLYPSVGVKSGTAENPITIRNYPGEDVVLNGDGVGDVIGVRRVSYWTIQGFEMVRGSVHLYDGISTDRVHDIIIKDNYIHDQEIYTVNNNVGMINIGIGGNQGAAYNIFIWNNTISELYFTGEYGNWHSMTDEQHMAGVTVLSACAYNTYDYGCTGYIEIINNTIYNVPQIFFFKNSMDGPIKIENNLLFSAGALGINIASNVLFKKNLVYDVDGGFSRLGDEDDCSVGDLCKVAGNNCTIIENTFVGLNSMLNGMRSGVNHTVKNNVIFGLPGRRTGAGYDTSSYISRSTYSYVPDPIDPDFSTVQTIESDDNCFITPYEDFLAVKRNLVSAPIDFYNLSEATTTFGFDRNSINIVETDPDNFFVDPANDDYHLIDPDLCPGMGYYATTSSSGSGNSDVNSDGSVNIIDLALTIYWQGKIDSDGDWSWYDHLDVNSDGSVNWGDVIEVLKSI